MTIGVLAILVSVLLPALAGARRTATEFSCASRIRELGRMVVLYSGDYDDRFPSALGDGPEVRQDRSMWISYTFQVFSTFPREPWLAWTGMDHNSELLYCPENQEWPYSPGITNPDFVLSASVFAESSYFDPSLPAQVWRARLGAKVQRHAAAIFPDRKVAVFEHRVWHGWPGSACVGCPVDGLFYYDSPRPGSVWFLDGHVDQLVAADALPHVYRHPIWPHMPLGTTEWGIAGRDVP